MKDIITSPGNAQVKNVIALKSKAKVRNEQGCFVVEGIRMFVEIPENMLVKAYLSESFYKGMTEEQTENLETKDYEIVSDEVFKKMSDTISPQGIMAVVKKSQLTILDIEEKLSEKKDKLIMILEDIQDPGNLGTIFRTAEAAGVDYIMMSKNTVDIYNPKVVRSTMGAIFRMPFVYEENLEEGIETIKKSGVQVFAAHLKGENNHFDENYKGGTAFMIGNEGNGLSDKIADLADKYIKIPMCGKVESLNAANAATILMYEALRQRMSSD